MNPNLVSMPSKAATEQSGGRIPGFYRLDLPERHVELARRFDLNERDIAVLTGDDGLCMGRADKMVENCVGVFALPLGLGLNFMVNGREMAVPMVVEEASVVAAVSNMARLIRASGGFQAESDDSLMIGQLQVLDVENVDAAMTVLNAKKDEILAYANEIHPSMKRRGGGAVDLEVRCFGAPWPMLVVHLLVDCQEAMGANAVNTMAEGVAPIIERLTGGRVHLRILSNLADRRRARATCRIREGLLATANEDGPTVAEAIVDAYRFAAVDPYRAATHNKGVMNGIDAVAIATGNDWRSIEAGAHAFAARTGRYTSLTQWWREDGFLYGRIELPMAIGVVGGATNVHPTIGVLRKIMGNPTAAELGGIIAAVGLAQNLGALKALATEGIQRGHMTLHARSVALEAGAEGVMVDRVSAALVALGQVKVDVAKSLMARIEAEPINGDRADLERMGLLDPIAPDEANADDANAMATDPSKT